MATLAPVAGKERIEVLDVLRGLAILGIFFMNVPTMAAPVMSVFHDPQAIGWTRADAASWMGVQVLLEGTQRCLLEFLFGAGAMVLTARAMAPDGPVAVADLFYRRNLWLLGFGLVDIFVLLWPGDILHVYAVAALFLFPFRKLGPKALVAVGCLFALYSAAFGAVRYEMRADLIARAEVARTHEAARQPLSASDRAALTEWRELRARGPLPPQAQEIARMEGPAHQGGFLPYAMFAWGGYVMAVYPGLIVIVMEAFCAMCLGMALWKWRVIQGGRSLRFYAVTAVVAYAVAVPLRYVGALDVLDHSGAAKLFWPTNEVARLLMGLGHLALVNLLMKLAAGRALLLPFRAAGRTAFSLYFLEQIIGIWLLFAPWGPGWWGKFGWAGITLTAVLVCLFNLVLANLWLRWFEAGPLEWAWRSLSYWQRQPFRRIPGPLPTTPEADPGPRALAA
jgi:uncharacterized protein